MKRREKKRELKAGVFLPKRENQAPRSMPVLGEKVCSSSGARVNIAFSSGVVGSVPGFPENLPLN